MVDQHPAAKVHSLCPWSVRSVCAFGLYLQSVPLVYTFSLCLWSIPSVCAFGLYVQSVPLVCALDLLKVFIVALDFVLARATRIMTVFFIITTAGSLCWPSSSTRQPTRSST